MCPRTLTVCAEPGCPTIVSTRYCAEHRRRDTRGARGYGTAAWQRARAAYLREHRDCEYGRRSSLLYPVQIICGAIATDVHHIDGRGPRGPRGLDPGNLMALCKAHHSQITAYRRHHA